MKTTIKGLCIVLAAVLLFSLPLGNAYAADVTAAPTKQTVQINDKTVALQAYNINGNNYFMLRDLAMALKETVKKFSVDWDGAAESIRLISSRVYVPIGGELVISSQTADVKAVPTTSKVYLDGDLVNLTAYNIGGNNYFKLRDVGQAINFGVTYDDTTKNIKIDTSSEYYIAAVLDILQGAFYNEATGKIVYNDTDTGNMTVYKFNDTYYSIAADNISSDNDYAKLKNLIGIFVSTPEKVLDALKASKTEGKKEIQIDGISVECLNVGFTQTVDIDW